MAQVFLVCEGERNSADLRLLDAVLAQHYGLPIQIEPGGGANQPRIVRRWLEQRVVGDIDGIVRVVREDPRRNGLLYFRAARLRYSCRFREVALKRGNIDPERALNGVAHLRLPRRLPVAQPPKSVTVSFFLLLAFNGAAVP